MSSDDRSRMLSYFHATRKQVLNAIDGISAAQMTFKPAPEKWSVAEVVEHLTVTEPYLFTLTTRILAHSLPRPTDQSLTTDQLIARMTDRTQPAQAPAKIAPKGRWQPWNCPRNSKPRATGPSTGSSTRKSR